ncbi:hypothetical protein [Ruminococcus sp.]|uniref:hypothetical protein n=1 Tax=Ruminococcus sp. TaxID=41978 RepID=UPI00386C1C7A
MKRKIIALISVFALSFSAFAFSVSAVEGEESGGEIIETEPAPDPEPTYEPEPEPTYEPEPEPTYYPDPEPTYYPEPDPTEPYVEPTYDNSDSGDKPYYSNDDGEVYVGGGQSTYTVPETTAPPAQMYSVSRDTIDDKTLSKSDWNDISANLKNASLTDSDGDDFSFIKKNESKSDNGHWMLYVGIACLVLGIAGIVYFIVATVQSRGRYKFATNTGKAPKEKKRKFDTADVELPKHTTSSKGGTRFKH